MWPKMNIPSKKSGTLTAFQRKSETLLRSGLPATLNKERVCSTVKHEQQEQCDDGFRVQDGRRLATFLEQGSCQQLFRTPRKQIRITKDEPRLTTPQPKRNVWDIYSLNNLAASGSEKNILRAQPSSSILDIRTHSVPCARTNALSRAAEHSGDTFGVIPEQGRRLKKDITKKRLGRRNIHLQPFISKGYSNETCFA